MMQCGVAHFSQTLYLVPGDTDLFCRHPGHCISSHPIIGLRSRHAPKARIPPNLHTPACTRKGARLGSISIPQSHSPYANGSTVVKIDQLSQNGVGVVADRRSGLLSCALNSGLWVCDYCLNFMPLPRCDSAPVDCCALEDIVVDGAWSRIVRLRPVLPLIGVRCGLSITGGFDASGIPLVTESDRSMRWIARSVARTAAAW